MNLSPSLTVLFALGLVQGCLIGGVLLLLHRKNRPLKWLGLFLLAYSLPQSTWLMQALGVFDQHPRWKFLPIGFFFAGLPLFYLYARSLTGRLPPAAVRRNLTPALLEFVVLTVICCLPDAAYAAFARSVFNRLFGLAFTLGLDVFSIFYALRVVHLVRQHRRRLPNFYADLHRRLLAWVELTAWVLVGLYLAELVITFFVYQRINYNLYVQLSAALTVVFIYWVAISGLRQSTVPLALPPEEEDAAAADSTPTLALPQLVFVESALAAGSALPAPALAPAVPAPAADQESQAADLAKIVALLEQGLYKEPDLTLAGLADRLGLSYKRVSLLINEQAGMNFNKFVNQYRVEEAKRLLADSAYRHLNHTGIAQAAGFRAKSTFYQMFRELTGLTPSQFQKSAGE